MADLQQYPLPNQNVQSIGQTAANVPPNPLSGIGPGISSGFGMGLQLRQIQALEQERQTQLMAAQNAAIQAKRENDLKALDTVGAQYERLAKTHPDTAFDFYQSTMAPLFSSVLRDHGIQADFQSEANPLHETADSVKRIHDAVTGLADGSIDMPTFQKIMNREQSGHNVGDYLQKRIDEATKAGNTIQDYNKNQQSLAQQWVQGAENLRGDTVFKGLETQRNSAAQGYSTLKSYQKPDGSFDLSNAQIIDLYGQLWKAQTGGVLSPQELNEMNQNSIQKNYAKLAGIVGLSKNALPTEFGNRLLTMFNQLGSFTDQQHSTMESVKNAKPGGLVDPQVIADTEKRIGRGMTFQEMKAKADNDYQARTNRVTFVDSQGITHSIPKENLAAAKKRDPGLKVIQ